MFSIEDAWDTAKPQHKDYVISQINKFLKYPPTHEDYISCSLLRKFCQRYREELACGDVANLRKLVTIYIKLRAKSGAGPYMDLFIKEASRIFNYKYFSTKRKKPWCAYELCKTSPYRICPYCNQNFAFTLTSDDGDFRPTLDHYFTKKDYPFLAISLYNLVPSCYTCNSNLKGSKDFFLNPHLHPFAIETEVEFELTSRRKTSIVKLAGNRLLLEKYGTIGIRPTTRQCVANSIETFQLKARFDMHQKEFVRFAYLRKQLTKGRIREIQRIIGQTVDVQTLLGFHEGAFKNHIHGKVFLDLFKQFNPRS